MSESDLDQLVARLEHAAAIIPSAWTTSMLFRECVAALAERDRRIAELSQAHDVVLARCVTQESRIAEALEYCEDREDIVDGEHGPRPNDFMHLATILKGCVA